MHTEKEAQTKWCPMVRVGNDNQSAENRNCRLAEVSDGPGKGAVWNCCIASSCMMWRWVTTLDGDKGYCGLAGVPK